MKKSNLLLFFLFAVVLPAKSIELKVTANETNGLVQFLMNCERQDETNALYILLKNSKYNNEQTQNMLAKWNELEKFNVLKFEDFPETRHNASSVYDLIIVQSVSAKNADELLKNCMGFFTQSELKKFRDVLVYFEPIYRELVWKPNLKTITAKVKEINTYVKDKNIGSLFNKAATFYGTKWENDLPFYVMINPLPGHVQHTSARPMGHVLIADVVLNDNKYEGWLGVIFHEMCHVLFKNQPREKQKQLEKLFTAHEMVNYRLGAYNWLDETLATALGNGWVYEQITGKTDTTEWYDNTYINRFAHALYPLVKTYAEHDKTIGADFVNESIIVFARTFSQINYETDHLFTFVDMVADTMPQESYMELFKYFRPRYMGCETPFDETNLTHGEHHVRTRVFLITSDHEKKLALVKANFPMDEIKPGNKSCLYYDLENNGMNYLVIVLNNPAEFAKAMEKIGRTKTFKDKKGVVELE